MTLKIKNISKKYDNRWVIKEVSFEVARGEILGIFGVVGVGKSTLLRTIAGNEQHDEGEIFFDEVDLSERPCKDRGFHFPDITNTSFWQSIFNTDNRSQLADGEGQALALETALEISQDVLILDNQFCFMDRQMREKKAEHLRKVIKEKNVAVVFATNDYEEVFTICDRVAILHDGQLVQMGTAKDVYENPNSVAVAKVTGRNNIIRARRLTSNQSRLPEFVTIDGEHRVYTNKRENIAAAENNQELNLAIRPEHISISFGASFPEDNLIKAEIIEISYLGATTLVTLNAHGLILKALVLRLVGLNIGDECMVGLPPDRIQVFED